jgi:hypothetical protein
MVWPLESVWQQHPDAGEYLQELVKQGLSAGEATDKLTARFMVTFTRSQVMGKLKRMRLSLRRAEIRAEKPPEPPPPPKLPPPRKVSSFNSVIRREFQQPSFPPIPAPLSTHPGYRFADVPRNGCMFEISPNDTLARDFRFCGMPRFDTEPYCEQHFELTLAPANYRLKLKAHR